MKRPNYPEDANQLDVFPKIIHNLKPIQGNYLLSLEEKYRNINVKNETERIIKSGCLAIDELLGGGLEGGNIIGLSCEGVEGRIFSFNLLSSVLIAQLKAPKSLSTPTKAIIIDSTGSMPLTLFSSILKSRIIAENKLSSNLDTSPHEDEDMTVDNQIQHCLEMVNISRIFDLEGLWEVLGETENVKHVFAKDLRSSPQTLGNSIQASAMEDGIKIMVIDNMTALLSEYLTSREKVDAHNNLKLLSEKLLTFTRERNILNLIHNTTVISNPPPFKSNNLPFRSDNAMSIFPSNRIKPALGQIFAQFTSLHLLFSSLPRTSKDTNLVYQKIQRPNRKSELDLATNVLVIEVLKDNCSQSSVISEGIGWREGRWTAVDLSKDKTDFIRTFHPILKN